MPDEARPSDRPEFKDPSFGARYTVDSVPPCWRPAYWLCSYAAAALMYGYFRIVRWTSRVTIHDRPTGDAVRSRLFACWHDLFPLYLATEPSFCGQVWMVLPSWYMKPMHLLARWSGVERLVMGASGHGGKPAARLLATYLAAGRSTVFLPDGPTRDPRRPHKGILHLARDSGQPILPIRVRAAPLLRLPTWDRKAVPLPFSRIEVKYGPPLPIPEIDDAALDALASALSAAPMDRP